MEKDERLHKVESESSRVCYAIEPEHSAVGESAFAPRTCHAGNKSSTNISNLGVSKLPLAETLRPSIFQEKSMLRAFSVVHCDYAYVDDINFFVIIHVSDWVVFVISFLCSVCRGYYRNVDYVNCSILV